MRTLGWATKEQCSNSNEIHIKWIISKNAFDLSCSFLFVCFFFFVCISAFFYFKKKTHAIRFIVATMTENKRIEKFKFKIDVVGALVQQCNKFITERNSIVHFVTYLQLRDHSSQCQCGMKARRLTLHSYIFRKQLAVHYSMWRSLSLTRIAEREN